MRRLLAIGAVSVGMFLAFAAVCNDSSVLAATTNALTLSRLSLPTPGCTLTPAVTFCDQTVGSTSAAKIQFTLTATSTATALKFAFTAVPGLAANFAAADFTVLPSSTCGSSLTVGTGVQSVSCVVDVGFTPTAAGLREAYLTATDASSSDKAVATVAGHASALALTLPSAISCPANNAAPDNAFLFCDQAELSTSGQQTFTLSSSSAVSGVTLALAAVPGLTSEFNASDFTIATTNCGPTLAAAGSCTAQISFRPSATGFRAAALTATDATGDSTSVNLVGNGFAVGHSNAGLILTPPGTVPLCSPGNVYQFCNTPTGGSTAPVSYTLKNVSGVQLTGLSIPTATTAGDFKVVNSSCLSVLANGSQCTVNVIFAPQTTGLLQEPLVITDAGGDVATANLAGTGDNYSLALAPMQPTEVSVAQGGTVTVAGQVIADSVFGQDGEQVTFTCPPTASMPINTSCAVTPCPAAITPGGATNFTVTFVTSSKKVQAPVPTAGCSSYGPPPVTAVAPPTGPATRAPGGSPSNEPWRLFPDAVLALFALLLALVGCFAATRRRHGMIFAGAAIVAALLIGCHHGSALTTATPVGTTAMNIQGVALDANGNSLNTSRTIQGPQVAGFALDVLQGQ